MKPIQNQNTVSAKRGIPVELASQGSTPRDAAPETVQLYYFDTGVLTEDAGQAAGEIVVAMVQFGPILDEMGAALGSLGNSSLGFTSTALTTEREFRTSMKDLDYLSLSERAARITEGFAEGEFCVDHEKKMIYGVKADNSVSLTSATYKYPVSPASSSADDPLPVYDAVASATPGATTVTVAGTAEQLTTDPTPAKYVALTVPSTNTGRIAWGDETVVAGTNGSSLGAGQTIIIPVPGEDLSNLYIDSTVSGEGATWTILS